MTELTLETAQKIAAATLKTAREKSFKPLAVVVYDARGALKALLVEDGTSLKRAEIAMGKAYGALALGVGTRALHKMAMDRPYFIAVRHPCRRRPARASSGRSPDQGRPGRDAGLRRAFRAIPPTMTKLPPQAGSRPPGWSSTRGPEAPKYTQVFVISGFSKILDSTGHKQLIDQQIG